MGRVAISFKRNFTRNRQLFWTLAGFSRSPKTARATTDCLVAQFRPLTSRPGWQLALHCGQSGGSCYRLQWVGGDLSALNRDRPKSSPRMASIRLVVDRLDPCSSPTGGTQKATLQPDSPTNRWRHNHSAVAPTKIHECAGPRCQDADDRKNPDGRQHPPRCPSSIQAARPASAPKRSCLPQTRQGTPGTRPSPNPALADRPDHSARC